VFLRPALIALQFLTRFPIRLTRPPPAREVGLSLLWYPAAGFLLGLLLWLAAILLSVSALAAPLAAALELALWVSCTGALHLDGLADTADAWVGGHGDRERTLEIMKDSHSGPVAVVAVVCLLLVKFGALSALFDARSIQPWRDLHFACRCVLSPVLARAAVPVLFAHTSYTRLAGVGADLAHYQSRRWGLAVAAFTVLSAMFACGRYGVAASTAAIVVYVLMRRAFVRRLGGVSGDCVGAIIEVIEAVTLATVVSL